MKCKRISLVLLNKPLSLHISQEPGATLPLPARSILEDSAPPRTPCSPPLQLSNRRLWRMRIKDLVPHPLGAAFFSMLLLGPPARQMNERKRVRENLPPPCSEREAIHPGADREHRLGSSDMVGLFLPQLSEHKFPTVAGRREGCVCGR